MITYKHLKGQLGPHVSGEKSVTKNEHFLKLCLEGQLGPRRAALAKLNKTPRIRRGPGKGGQDVFVNSPFCEYLSETAKEQRTKKTKSRGCFFRTYSAKDNRKVHHVFKCDGRCLLRSIYCQ